jgi:pectate lyase
MAVPSMARGEHGSREIRRAFRGAQGWAAETPGGRGGQIIRVTTLDASGPGSLREAVTTSGPRIVVFEVGGVIDLAKQSISIDEPFLTVAGQTAPSPGITLIRGGIQIATHDVVIRHLRVRPGEAGAGKKSGWEVDAIATNAAYNVIVDHCSCTWATDENLSASGPRFAGGDTVEQWRKSTSHRVTFSNCIVAECLHRSTHGKGPHSKGSLIHDNATEIAIIANLYASNVQRNPLFKGGAQGVIVNNFISNPGNRAIHYRLPAGEWEGRVYATGQMAVVGNVMQSGIDTVDGLPLVKYDGEGVFSVFLKDNLAMDRKGKEVEHFVGASPRPGRECRMLSDLPFWPAELEAMPANDVREYVARNVGARPWDRDEIDTRIVRAALDGTGRIIDSEEEVGGYPVAEETRTEFDPNDWESLLEK